MAAPIEEVWDLWSRYEEFPKFMGDVRDVRRAADGSSHGRSRGPAGVPLEWQTVETLPNVATCASCLKQTVVHRLG